MLNNLKAALFDLDGVIVDTAKYHYRAWKKLANSLGIEFTESDNEKLKGVNRVQSMDLILKMGNKELSDDVKNELMDKKNSWYVDYISKMTSDEILPGAVEYIKELKKRSVKIGLGSASKNAQSILKSLSIIDLFDVIIDGTKVEKSKPDPEVFISGCNQLNVDNKDCVVYEDSLSGIEAGKRAGMYVVGIGSKDNLPDADIVVSGLHELIK